MPRSLPGMDVSATPAGYADPAYAASLSHVGSPRPLPRSGGSILVRAVPGTSESGAVGPYPLFACPRWEELAEDVQDLRGDLLTLTLVADPLGSWSVSQLEAAFPDRCVPFKEHFVVDLSRPPLESASRHHRRDATRALRRVSVELVDDPATFLDEWDCLYGELVRRHRITGPAAFPRASFAAQLSLHGLRAFRAARGGELLGAALWLVDGSVAHYHLAAGNDAGYREAAAYALVATALEYFVGQGLAWAALGAGPALQGGASDGLTSFKEGWSTDRRMAYLCGRIFDHARYAELTKGSPGGDVDYFPAYRDGARN